MEPWAWALLLMVLGMGLLVLEVFFPSAGILGFLSASSILAAIIFGFRGGVLTGLVTLLVAVVGIPTVAIFALKIWPRTAMGRRVMLMTPSSKDVLPQDAERDSLKQLIGQVGEAKCQMLPGGIVSLDGHTIDAVSEGMPIDSGQRVRVIKVWGHRVVVRPLEEEEPSSSAEDPLRRPIDSVAPDPFEEPPA